MLIADRQQMQKKNKNLYKNIQYRRPESMSYRFTYQSLSDFFAVSLFPLKLMPIIKNSMETNFLLVFFRQLMSFLLLQYLNEMVWNTNSRCETACVDLYMDYGAEVYTYIQQIVIWYALFWQNHHSIYWIHIKSVVKLQHIVVVTWCQIYFAALIVFCHFHVWVEKIDDKNKICEIHESKTKISFKLKITIPCI